MKSRMQKIKFLTFALVTVLTATGLFVGDTCAQQFVTKGLISFWTFDSSTITGQTVKDVFGKNDGIMKGAPKISDGKIGQALELDGVKDYVNISQPQAIPSGNDTYAIEAWFYANVMKIEGIIGWGSWGSGNQVNALRLGTDVNGFRHYWWGNDLDVATGNINGAWHHVVAQFDGKTRSLWFDGKLMKSDQPAGHNAQISDVNIGVTNNRSEYWSGKLDEIRLYNRALGDAEVQQNYKVTSNTLLAVTPVSKLSTCWGTIKGEK